MSIFEGNPKLESQYEHAKEANKMAWDSLADASETRETLETILNRKHQILHAIGIAGVTIAGYFTGHGSLETTLVTSGLAVATDIMFHTPTFTQLNIAKLNYHHYNAVHNRTVAALHEIRQQAGPDKMFTDTPSLSRMLTPDYDQLPIPDTINGHKVLEQVNSTLIDGNGRVARFFRVQVGLGSQVYSEIESGFDRTDWDEL